MNVFIFEIQLCVMTLTKTYILLYETLKKKIGTEEAGVLVEFVDQKIKNFNDQNLKYLATKEDLKDLRVEIATTKTDIIRWVFGFCCGNYGNDRI